MRIYNICHDNMADTHFCSNDDFAVQTLTGLKKPIMNVLLKLTLTGLEPTVLIFLLKFVSVVYQGLSQYVGIKFQFHYRFMQVLTHCSQILTFFSPKIAQPFSDQHYLKILQTTMRIISSSLSGTSNTKGIQQLSWR